MPPPWVLPKRIVSAMHFPIRQAFLEISKHITIHSDRAFITMAILKKAYRVMEEEQNLFFLLQAVKSKAGSALAVSINTSISLEIHLRSSMTRQAPGRNPVRCIKMILLNQHQKWSSRRQNLICLQKYSWQSAQAIPICLTTFWIFSKIPVMWIIPACWSFRPGRLRV